MRGKGSGAREIRESRGCNTVRFCLLGGFEDSVVLFLALGLVC